MDRLENPICYFLCLNDRLSNTAVPTLNMPDFKCPLKTSFRNSTPMREVQNLNLDSKATGNVCIRTDLQAANLSPPGALCERIPTACGVTAVVKSSVETMAVCINCNILLRPDRQPFVYHAVDFEEECVLIIEEWCGHEIADNDRLCQECVQLILHEANQKNQTENPGYISNRLLGHVCVCISCGISLSRRSGRRRRKLEVNSAERNFIANHIFPRQIPIESWACNACWMRAHQNATQFQPLDAEPANIAVPAVDAQAELTRPSSSTTTPSSEDSDWEDQLPNSQPPRTRDTIKLHSYTRTPDTTSHCFMPGCVNKERLRVPQYLRKSILLQYKIYVTNSARVCEEHSVLSKWDILTHQEFITDFSANHLEDMLHLLHSAASTF